MTQRTDQVESQIQRILGAVLNREIELPEGHLATITRVLINPDLKNAKVFISVLPFANSNSVMKILKNNRGMIQKELHSQLTMKFSPKLEFLLDKQPEYADQIEKLIDEEMTNN